MQANGTASIKEQAKAAASKPAKPALKASAAGNAAPSISAALAQNVAELESSAQPGSFQRFAYCPHLFWNQLLQQSCLQMYAEGSAKGMRFTGKARAISDLL